jgi:Putative zinc-binding metallo-peptidase
MRYKVLSLFLAVQFASFALWQGVQALENTDKPAPVIVTATTQAAIPSHDADLPSLGQIHFSAKEVDDSYQALDVATREELVSVMDKLPAAHTSSLRNLVLDMDPNAGRGLGGRDIIILRGVGMDEAETAGVLIHEIGHNVDLGVLTETDQSKTSEFRDGKGNIYESDPSLGFYRLSWDNEYTRKKTSTNYDFVSGYAMTDPFEDFAETYAYYVLHGQDFRAKTLTSDVLQKKYDFMKNVVFKGKEYDVGDTSKADLQDRPWDVTVLNYDLNSFLNG